MLRKRTYATRTRSKSTRPKKMARMVYNPQPSFARLNRNTINARPQYTRANLYYFENNISINPSAGAAAVYVFTVNGLYDPNITGIGHQPSGFDQYMALYNQYVVLGSTIKVTFANTEATQQQVCGIFVEDLATTSPDMRKYVENGNGVWSNIGPAGAGSQPLTLRHSCDVSKYSHTSIYNEENFAGSSSSNPNNTHYYHIVGIAADGSTDVGVLVLNVEIRYDVIFRDPYLAELS